MYVHNVYICKNITCTLKNINASYVFTVCYIDVTLKTLMLAKHYVALCKHYALSQTVGLSCRILPQCELDSAVASQPTLCLFITLQVPLSAFCERLWLLWRRRLGIRLGVTLSFVWSLASFSATSSTTECIFPQASSVIIGWVTAQITTKQHSKTENRTVEKHICGPCRNFMTC